MTRPVVGERLGQKLVPDGLWEIVEPLLIPPQTERPQGVVVGTGGARRAAEDSGRASLGRPWLTSILGRAAPRLRGAGTGARLRPPSVTLE
jgi:hypothetical protein